MKARDLYGKEVIDAEAKVVGSVNDVELDNKKWIVSGIIVKTGFLKKLVIQSGDIDRVGDKVVLKVTLSKIQKT